MKLIKRTNSQRFYQLDFKVKIGSSSFFMFGSTKVDIRKLFEANPILFKGEYELAEDVLGGIDKICISDSHTHTERLVFPAFNIRNKNTGEVMLSHRNNNIDGRHTMLIHGGDDNAVYDDKVYVRHLRILNRKQNT